MKTRYLWSALFSACIAFSGCSDDVLEDQSMTPWHEGEGIAFGARAGFEKDGPKSRTEYTGEFDKEHKYERVDWVVANGQEDEIGIYCEEAHITHGTRKLAEYKATSHYVGSDNRTDFAAFLPKNEGTALQWGDVNTPHNFYAFYPSESQMTDPSNPERKGLEFNETDKTITGIVPVTQLPVSINPVTENGVTTYVARPQMRNAVMTATNSIIPLELNGAPVSLSFKSIVTVLELDFVAKEAKTLYSIIVRSKKHNISGRYKAELDNLTNNYPTFTSLAEGTEASKQIIVPLQDAGKIVSGLDLQANEHLKVTVFLLPQDNLDDLEITVQGLRGQKSHALKGNEVAFKAHLKHYINNITLPKAFNESKWLGLIDDNVYLSQLSIPGTGGSYSAEFKFTGNDTIAGPIYKQTQTRTIAEQWAMGIRCFDISCSDEHFLENFNNNLGDSPVQVNKEIPNPDLTLRMAVKDIMARANSSQTEFAIVILTYQPKPGKGRQPGRFVRAFNNLLSELDQTQLAIYKPSEILGNVRRKTMFILRPTSNGEDDTMPADAYNQKYVAVHGWGSLQDKWANRGYLYKSRKKPYQYIPVSNNPMAPVIDLGFVKFTNTVEGEYLVQRDKKSATEAPKFPALDFNAIQTTANFDYSTVNGFNVWAQEWPRVVPGDNTARITECIGTGSIGTRYDWVSWWGSYKEKYDNATSTFDLAVQNNKANTDVNTHKLYINSLCGYFVEAGNKNSIHPDYRNASFTPSWGFATGIIPAFSDQINQDFFDFMWTKWQERISGPMGIVLMNRVGIEDIEATYLMPNLVISNNFTFPLLKAPSQPGK